MISAIVLAAGTSSRMTKNKLLMTLGDKKIIQHVVEKVSTSDVDEIIIVLGRDSELIKKQLNRYDVRFVLNENYVNGQSTSVRAGISAIDKNSSAALFLLGDQPMISKDVLNTIIHEFINSDKSICLPTHKGKRGNPVLFDRAWYQQLSDIEGDKGGRTIIKSFPDEIVKVEIDDELFFMDIDDEESYVKMKHLIEKK